MPDEITYDPPADGPSVEIASAVQPPAAMATARKGMKRRFTIG